MKQLMQSAKNIRNFPVAPNSSTVGVLHETPDVSVKVDEPQSKAKIEAGYRMFPLPFSKTLSYAFSLLVAFIVTCQASLLSAQVAITANVPQYPFQVLAGSTRQINANITGGTLKTVNWSVLQTTGGASATFTTPNGADVSSVAGALATVQVNIGPASGNCTISGNTVTSTASVTVQAQSTDDPSKTATFLFNVCANSPATLANGTSSVVVAPAYQQAYQSQPMTLQSWVVGCTDETGTWSIINQPSGGDGTLVDTTYRDAVFSASVTGRYTIQYTANCNSGKSTAIVYVSPNPMPSYASTPNGTKPHECYVDPALTGGDYEVGSGKAYTTLSSTPAISGIKPGTIIRIWNTDTTGANPSIYHEYYNIQNNGSATQPIILCGVPDSSGNLPILDGTNATAQSGVNINADDGLIILFPAHTPYGYWQDGAAGPNYVSITGLHLRNAKSDLKRYDPGSGSLNNWSNFTGCINWRSGSYVDISGNVMENCSNGIFSAENDSNAWASITQNLTFMGNHVLGSGDPNYPVTTHQAYLQTYYGLIEGNLLDNPSEFDGCQVKWRGVEGIFRYNMLGDGAQRLFDLVDNQDGPAYITFEKYIGDGLPGYGDTAGANVIAAYQESFQKDFIYGNEMFGTSSEAAVHYAGDQGTPGLFNRNGVLHFFSNTLDDAQIIFDNGFAGNGLNTYFPQRVSARNNILWARTVSWTGLLHMSFAEFSPIILDATTNLMRSGTFSISTPILGDTWSNGTATGWPSECDGSCLWPLSVPLQTHLYGLTAANYLSTSTQPYDATTFVPPSGSAAIGAGTELSGNPESYMPVRWQFSVATGALTPRLDPLTIGASDPATSGTPVAAKPTFSPGSGTYSSTQTVTISSSTPGATIYYTTDGSMPTTASQSYSGPVTVSQSETISAIAVASGYANSPIASATYVITLGLVATPTFNPAGGTYTTTQQVTLSTTTAGATIYYTTNGATPTTNSTVYSGPITVSNTQTLSAIAVLAGYTNSAVATATYTFNLPQAATPIFNPGAGSYPTAQTVTISSTTPSAIIYYTTNGSTPTTSSTVYSGPITVSTSQTIRAIATASGYTNSAVATAAYAINQSQAATPLFSPGAGTYTSPQNVVLSTTTPSAIIYYTTNGRTPTTSSAVYSAPIPVTSTETIRAIAVATGFTNSAVGSATYTINLPAAATPTFAPGAGTYSSVQSVVISSSTPSATIHYTTNGSTPTTSSLVYSGPITVNTSETIKAIAIATGYSSSVVASAAYVINLAQTAPPTFTPPAGTYSSAQSVAISSSTPSATIYYTTNGSTPTTSSAVYSGPISVAASQTIKAMATVSGLTASSVSTAAYIINAVVTTPAATPTFTPAAGTYTSAQSVTITSSTPSATIFYTTNGSTPTTSSTQYSGPISVSSTTTINAIATASGFTTSAVATATYTITASAAADFSISASPTSLTVSASNSGSTTVSVVPQNGFNSAVSLSCSGLPSGTSCSFSPATVTLSGSTASSVLTVSKSTTTALNQGPPPFVPVLAAAFGFIGWKKRRRLQMLVLLAVSAAGILMMNGCGGATFVNNSGTVSTVTITATAGSLQHSTTISVTVK
jgi:hypothetical protein